MDKEQKVILSGMSVTGIGLVLTSAFSSKSITAFNVLLFICFAIIAVSKNMQLKGISLKDLDANIDSRIDKSYQDKNYVQYAFYIMVRPCIMCALIFLGLYTLTLLMF